MHRKKKIKLILIKKKGQFSVLPFTREPQVVKYLQENIPTCHKLQNHLLANSFLRSVWRQLPRHGFFNAS